MSATMDEDRYLNLQNENRRLKKELDARETKHKQTLARLARAEEAAKRATLAASSKLGGSAADKMAAPTAARLFAAEQRAAELEEESRELTRKLQKEHEKTAHFKNLCKEYKAKLDDALKMARGIKPAKKTAADIGSVSVPRLPDMDTSSRRADSMAEQLRQERVRATTLASEVESLRRQLRQMEVKKGPTPAAAAPATLVGFADMFLPAVLASDIESELTRFVIACLSLTQLIYMSEIGALLLKSRIPLKLWELVVIFLLRTAITLPIIVVMAHWLVG